MFKSIYQTLRLKLMTWLTNEPPSTEIMPYDFNRLKYEIRPGDVLLIEGRSRVSHIIRTITQSSWTHTALYIGRLIDIEDEETQNLIRQHIDVKENVRLVVEDILDRGTVISTLSSYRNHHIRICRPIGISPSDLRVVIQYVLKSVGQPYNVRQILDLARFLLPWTIMPRRWGSSLFRRSSGEPESGVCSSLIAKAFTAVQFPILPFIKSDNEGIEIFHRNPYLFAPKDFDYSPYFEIIKYPLFNPDEPLPYYRRLPWTKSGFLHQDKGILTGPKIKKKKSEATSKDEKVSAPPSSDPKTNHNEEEDQLKEKLPQAQKEEAPTNKGLSE
jgi:hypothetical protein